MENNTETPKNFSLIVESSCRRDIKTTFETLLMKENKIQQEIADAIGKDKSYISRICHGLEVPPLLIRKLIAKALNCDSAEIWKLKYISELKIIIKDQKKKRGDKE